MIDVKNYAILIVTTIISNTKLYNFTRNMQYALIFLINFAT